MKCPYSESIVTQKGGRECHCVITEAECFESCAVKKLLDINNEMYNELKKVCGEFSTHRFGSCSLESHDKNGNCKYKYECDTYKILRKVKKMISEVE